MSERIIAPDAIRDLREISDYYAIHNVEAGERILKEFNKKCAYLVILEPGLEVVRVMRGDRDWRSWLAVD